MYTNFLRSLTAVIFSHVFASSLILIFVALYQAECYAALPFVHLLLESNFLPISRLATLFMHGLNIVFIFAALVMLFCAFALPFFLFLVGKYVTGNASRARAELGLVLNTCLDIKYIRALFTRREGNPGARVTLARALP